jgi:tetratricopeptide (TPR) repeat protein
MLGASGHIPREEAIKRARDAAQKALSLDDSLADAHDALGNFKFNYEWDLPGAEKEYQRALDLGPTTITASIQGYLMLTGRLNEAIAILEKEFESNPLYPPYVALCTTLFYARRYDESIAAGKKAIELNLAVNQARYNLLYTLAVKRMCAEAMAELKNFLSSLSSEPAALSDPNILEMIGYVYAQCGGRKKAEEMIASIKQSPNFDPASLSTIYASLGEKDLAIDALERSFEQRSPRMLWLKVEPCWDPLRDDPRYVALLKKVGFEK